MTSAAPQHKKTLYVGGLSENVTVPILTAAFIPFGDLLDVQIPRDQKSGKHRGFGFVEYDLKEDANAALDNMSGAELYGRTLKVSIAKPQSLPKNRAVWDETTWAEMQTQSDITDIVQAEGITAE
eukprot:CAMPEP_0168592856 /NCGR_PEP_ID=MMETSP0420-20121227/7974_1 /TAXON_ID=498008 /ORGANISM="Pessonella sp." /LENGTH=124 /DNA_ID=CAMNT_0008628909 /DNA_START=29 /DNA_END=403 /DNA_ORIENTATION=+